MLKKIIAFLTSEPFNQPWDPWDHPGVAPEPLIPDYEWIATTISTPIEIKKAIVTYSFGKVAITQEVYQGGIDKPQPRPNCLPSREGIIELAPIEYEPLMTSVFRAVEEAMSKPFMWDDATKHGYPMSTLEGFTVSEETTETVEVYIHAWKSRKRFTKKQEEALFNKLLQS